MGPKKQRECLAVLLGVFAVVGLCRKAGIYIPFVSKAVISVIQGVLLLISKRVEAPSVFLVYVKAFREHIVWCISSAWLGIAAWLWSSRDHSTYGVFGIIVYDYLFMMAFVSSSVFAFCYNLDPFFNIRFYSSSFALSLALSFAAGKGWAIVQELPCKNR